MKRYLPFLILPLLLAYGCKKSGGSKDNFNNPNAKLLLSSENNLDLVTGKIQVVTYLYDKNNRLLSMQSDFEGTHPKLLFTYDSDNNVKQAASINNLGDTTFTNFTYQNGESTISVASLNGGHFPPIRYVTANNKVIATSNPEHDTTKYTYSGNNLLTITQINYPNQLVLAVTNTYGTHKSEYSNSNLKYDLIGPTIRDNDLIEYKETFPANLDFKFRYTYNKAGYPMTCVTNLNGKDEQQKTFKYITAN